MPYGDIGEHMNKARVAEAARGFIPKLDVDLRACAKGD